MSTGNPNRRNLPPLTRNGLQDLKGQKFGKLTVLFKTASTAKGMAQWRCLCECGVRITVRHDYLLHTNTPKRHCGCANRGLPTLYFREYRIWKGMLARCENPRHVSYKAYGGRGITVCEEWHTFEVFLKDMGKAPTKSHSLDRIQANEGYKPGNVKWATAKHQARNKRNSLFLPHPLTAKMVPAAEVAEHYNITYQQLRYRYIKEGKWPRPHSTGKKEANDHADSKPKKGDQD